MTVWRAERGRAALIAALTLGGCIPPPAGSRRDAPPPVEAPLPAQASAPLAAGEQPRSVPQTKPAWQARPVTPDAVIVRPSTYTVVPGDSLRAIAEKTGAGSEAIARENGLSAPFTIRTGQKLRIPGGRYHRVRSGESGVAIARAYGVDWARVVALNDLEEPYILRINQRLLIPSPTEVARMSMEDRARAFQIDIDDIITGGEPAISESQRPAPPVASARRTLPASAAVGEPARFAGRFDWPLDGRVIDRFGPGAGGRRNDGINIAVKEGTPIKAAADGVVAYVGSEIAVYGGLILIKHGDGWITAYGHAEDLLVKRGQAVKRGQVIGRAGETGSAREPQLHFEIRRKRTPVDPIRELPRRG